MGRAGRPDVERLREASVQFRGFTMQTLSEVTAPWEQSGSGVCKQFV